MSIYGERAGALSVVTSSVEEAALVLGQLQATIRRNWSNPPKHAAEIPSHLLFDPTLRVRWTDEVEVMRLRIVSMRTALHRELVELMPESDFGHVLNQRGMLSYTGLSADQVCRMQIAHWVYLVSSGRICVAALNETNFRLVAE
jgi:aromatic-amino-acid transaminase